MMTNSNLTQTLTERSKSFKEPYEFIFKLNDNIIVQRFFTVNNYNPYALASLNLKEAIDDCAGLIHYELKSKALDFMDEFKYYFAEDPTFDSNTNDDVYYFQIRVEGRTVIERCWSATVYPAKIRYDVNIKRLIGRIIGIIQTALSTPSRKLITNYQSYDLIKTAYATAAPSQKA